MENKKPKKSKKSNGIGKNQRNCKNLNKRKKGRHKYTIN